MLNYSYLFKIALISFGSIFLVLSLFPIRNVANQFPKGQLKLKWNLLSVLVLIFIAGYILYAYDFRLNYTNSDSIDLIVPIIFSFGGIFVFLVGGLASQTAKNLQTIELLEYESTTDSLMAINNRRYFDKRIIEEISVSLRYGRPLSLLLIDVDNFKNVNDTYGHIAGDDVLKALAVTMKETARESDILARYGGEEIVMIAPDTSKDHAAILAERIRALIEKSSFPIPFHPQKNLKITISIGVSVLDSENAIHPEEFIEEADKALYKAKQEGRNRVIITC